MTTNVSIFHGVLAGLAASIGAMVNATAGGGTLVSFPTLTALGVPSLTANATNMVAMCPGYLAGTYAQRDELTGLGRALRLRVSCAAVGGLVGALLLVASSDELFTAIVPFLVLGSAAMLAAQDPLRRSLARRRRGSTVPNNPPFEVLSLFFAACYGGYFGAGLGIVLLAVMGLFSTLRFNQLNAIKQLLSIAIGLSSALFLAFSSHVSWVLVAYMVPGSLIGGTAGGRLASHIDPRHLRAAVVTCGCLVGLVYFLT